MILKMSLSSPAHFLMTQWAALLLTEWRFLSLPRKFLPEEYLLSIIASHF